MERATIERILDAASIEEVVGEFVTLRKAGVNYKGLCPFHEEKTPSFTVSVSKQIYKCFGCGKGGSVIHFIMEHEQLSYYEALKWLAHKYHIDYAEPARSIQEAEACRARESLFVLNEYACTYFQKATRELPYASDYAQDKYPYKGAAYLRERGFGKTVISKFRLGYCPENSEKFYRSAIREGYLVESLLQTGLCYKRDTDGCLQDRFAGRVIFPIHTLGGKVVGFGGRSIYADPKTAKYVNSPESIIYHKSDYLYGLYFANQAIAKADCCYLVEGYTVVLADR